MVFEQLVQTMIEMDVFYLFFPWLLVLAVTYGVLDKVDYFDEDSINAVVALAVSFIAIGGMLLFVPRTMFPQFAGALAFIIFAMIGLLVLMALAGYNIEEMEEDERVGRLAVTAGILLAAGVVTYQLDVIGYLIDLLGGGTGLLEDFLYLLFLLLVILVVTKAAGGNAEED